MLSGSLFTRDYLLEAVTATDKWRALDDARLAELRERLKHLVDALLRVAKPNEAQTEKNFIYPVLEMLGWSDVEVQQTLSSKGRKQVPDALLFANTASRDKAVGEKDQWRRYQHGLCIVEAKRWGRALDRADKRDINEEGVPSTQMLQYLSRVDVQTSGKVRLGILTNGVKWRLYFQGALAVSEDFFEIDLAKCLDLPGHDLDLFDAPDARLTRAHCLKLFLVLFDKAAFLPYRGPQTFHDVAREISRVWEEAVTRDLSTLVFKTLFPMLVQALAAHDPDRVTPATPEYLDQVKTSALVLLYRLLFVVYAEDRDLLPDQQEPYKSYSLTTMRLDIAARKDSAAVFSEHASTYWPKLTAVFRAIAEGDDSLGIPPYNGGLFARDTAPLLNRVQLPDALLAELIFRLSHRSDGEGRSRYINYRDLTVQHLGTIYERTLEYGLEEENGDVVVDADDTARHESGSYYTPDSLVSLIIEKSVGPFIEERQAAFREKAAALATDSRPEIVRLAELQGVDPALGILELRICDPAMGSGHFLVNLVDYLADKALAAIGEAEALVDWSDKPYHSPVLAGIEQTRTDIIRQATLHKWPFVVEHLDDRHVIRRTILKRCIYGVDLNPMAVELAKVALWLHTFTVGAPLSFLDHHLRSGNSLLGYWVAKGIDSIEKWGGQLLINEPLQKATAQAVAMARLERVNDIDIAEVHQSKTLFDGIEQETRPLNAFLRLMYAIDTLKLTKDEKAPIKAWLDGQLGDPFDIARGAVRLGPNDVGTGLAGAKNGLERLGNSEKRAAEAFVPVLNRARTFVANHRLHNWQIAFPGVWRNWDGKQLEGGFHAVIGNPPYVRQELIKALKPMLKRDYPGSYDGSADLFVYFYELGFTLLKPGGRLSYVVTNKWLKAGYGENLRGFFADKAWLDFIADFGHAKSFFPDADVFPSVLVARKPDDSAAPITTDVCAIPRDDVPEKGLDAAVAKATYSLQRAHFLRESWVLEPPEVIELLSKIRAGKTTLSEYVGAKPSYGIKTGLNEAFLIDTPTKDRLVAEHASAAEIIKPYLRGQDVGRWSASWQGLWMIFMRRGTNLGDYPSIERHLTRYRTQLLPKPSDWKPPESDPTAKWPGRKEGNYAWYELQDAVDYFSEFEKPKIVYQVIQFHPRYSLDRDGRYSNDKTFILPSDDAWLLAVLNSPLMWWHNWRHLIHLKDEALSPMGYRMETVPIAEPTPAQRKRVQKLVAESAAQTDVIRSQTQAVLDWLAFRFKIVKPSRRLQRPECLEVQHFLEEVDANLPGRATLSAADLQELRREYTALVAKARKAAAGLATAESDLSDLVNEAYGLTPAEVALMWRTAPPRMPIAGHMTDDHDQIDEDA